MSKETTTWWRASSGLHQVLPVEVVKETKTTVLVKGASDWGGAYRANKTSDGVWFRPTREEAIACLVEYATGRAEKAERDARYWREEAAKAEALREPPEAA